MTDTSIYAELLLNIRQITVVVSLPSPYNDATNVRLSDDRRSLSVIHDGRHMTVRLPAPVRHVPNPTVAPGSTRALSFRLPILDEASYKVSSTNDGHGTKSLSAASMGPTTQVACRFCHTLLVREQVKIWKDLPSENWAEMMDFWHCHKPDTDDSATQKQDGGRKGYGAASSIRPTSATGLVDIISFHLVQQDCNVTVTEDLMALKVSCFYFIHSTWLTAGGAVAIRRRPVFYTQWVGRRYNCQISSFASVRSRCTLSSMM